MYRLIPLVIGLTLGNYKQIKTEEKRIMSSLELLMEDKCMKLKTAALAIICIPAYHTYESLLKSLKELESEFDRVAPHSATFKDKEIWD